MVVKRVCLFAEKRVGQGGRVGAMNKGRERLVGKGRVALFDMINQTEKLIMVNLSHPTYGATLYWYSTALWLYRIFQGWLCLSVCLSAVLRCYACSSTVSQI